MTEIKTVLAWHFTDGMRYRDGSELVVGQACQHIADIEICARGWHGSEDILHALRYAPGAYLSRTAHSGRIKRESDKLVSQDRTPLWTIDVMAVLVVFARACADSAAISARRAAAYCGSASARAVKYADRAAEYADRAAEYAADSVLATWWANNAAGAAADAAVAEAAAATWPAAEAEREWQSVVLLQLIYDRICEARNA